MFLLAKICYPQINAHDSFVVIPDLYKALKNLTRPASPAEAEQSDPGPSCLSARTANKCLCHGLVSATLSPLGPFCW